MLITHHIVTGYAQSYTQESIAKSNACSSDGHDHWNAVAKRVPRDGTNQKSNENRTVFAIFCQKLCTGEVSYAQGYAQGYAQVGTHQMYIQEIPGTTKMCFFYI